MERIIQVEPGVGISAERSAELGLALDSCPELFDEVRVCYRPDCVGLAFIRNGRYLGLGIQKPVDVPGGFYRMTPNDGIDIVSAIARYAPLSDLSLTKGGA